LSVVAGDSQRIDDSAYGASIYSGPSADPGSQPFASVKLDLMLPDQWHITTGRKTWVTTEFA